MYVLAKLYRVIFRPGTHSHYIGLVIGQSIVCLQFFIRKYRSTFGGRIYNTLLNSLLDLIPIDALLNLIKAMKRN